jgi:hypothetical protein
MRMGIRNLRRDEVEDLEGLLKQYGRRTEEFELSPIPAEPDSPPDVSALARRRNHQASREWSTEDLQHRTRNELGR